MKSELPKNTPDKRQSQQGDYVDQSEDLRTDLSSTISKKGKMRHTNSQVLRDLSPSPQKVSLILDKEQREQEKLKRILDLRQQQQQAAEAKDRALRERAQRNSDQAR